MNVISINVLTTSVDIVWAVVTVVESHQVEQPQPQREQEQPQHTVCGRTALALRWREEALSITPSWMRSEDRHLEGILSCAHVCRIEFGQGKALKVAENTTCAVIMEVNIPSSKDVDRIQRTLTESKLPPRPVVVRPSEEASRAPRLDHKPT